jgi:hypothetical protein
MQRTYDIIFRGVRETFVVLEKQQVLHIYLRVSVRVRARVVMFMCV